jgi:hypothetical protein
MWITAEDMNKWTHATAAACKVDKHDTIVEDYALVHASHHWAPAALFAFEATYSKVAQSIEDNILCRKRSRREIPRFGRGVPISESCRNGTIEDRQM